MVDHGTYLFYVSGHFPGSEKHQDGNMCHYVSICIRATMREVDTTCTKLTRPLLRSILLDGQLPRAKHEQRVRVVSKLDSNT